MLSLYQCCLVQQVAAIEVSLLQECCLFIHVYHHCIPDAMYIVQHDDDIPIWRGDDDILMVDWWHCLREMSIYKKYVLNVKNNFVSMFWQGGFL